MRVNVSVGVGDSVGEAVIVGGVVAVKVEEGDGERETVGVFSTIVGVTVSERMMDTAPALEVGSNMGGKNTNPARAITTIIRTIAASHHPPERCLSLTVVLRQCLILAIPHHCHVSQYPPRF
jgi:hypothetical protein